MLGGIAILAASLAVCKAGAAVKEIPLYKHIANLAGNSNLVLPVPAFSVINGGAHAGNGDLMKEFMILPVGATSFKEAMKMGVEVRYHLKAVTKKKNSQDAAKAGDIGEIIQGKEEVQELLKKAIEKAGYVGKVIIGTDASEFYGEDKTCDLNVKEENNDGSQKIGGDALKNLYQSIGNEYPIVSIEDPFDQDDWEHCSKMTYELGEHVQIVGDDLLVANPKRVEKAINEKSCYALLLKVNERGTVTEIIEAVKLLKMAGRKVMASFWGSTEPLGMFNALLGKLFPCFGKCQGFGSEVTEDTFIADLTVGLAMGQIKTGAPCRSGRLMKYNRLLQIEEELGAEAVYAGANFRKPVEPY